MEQREGRDGGSSRKGGVCHCSIFNCFSTVYTETEIQLLIISSHSVNTDPCSWVRVNSSSPAGLKLFCKTRTFDFLHFFLLNCSVLLSLSPVFVQWYFIIWFIFFLSFLFPPSLCLCRSFRSRRYEPPRPRDPCPHLSLWISPRSFSPFSPVLCSLNCLSPLVEVLRPEHQVRRRCWQQVGGHWTVDGTVANSVVCVCVFSWCRI